MSSSSLYPREVNQSQETWLHRTFNLIFCCFLAKFYNFIAGKFLSLILLIPSFFRMVSGGHNSTFVEGVSCYRPTEALLKGIDWKRYYSTSSLGLQTVAQAVFEDEVLLMCSLGICAHVTALLPVFAALEGCSCDSHGRTSAMLKYLLNGSLRRVPQPLVVQ